MYKINHSSEPVAMPHAGVVISHDDIPLTTTKWLQLTKDGSCSLDDTLDDSQRFAYKLSRLVQRNEDTQRPDPSRTKLADRWPSCLPGGWPLHN